MTTGLTRAQNTAATNVFGIVQTSLWHKLYANEDAGIREKARALLEARLVIEEGKAVVLNSRHDRALREDHIWQAFMDDAEGGLEFLRNLMKKTEDHVLAYEILTRANNQGTTPLFVISRTPEGADKVMEFLTQSPQEWRVKMLCAANVVGELCAHGHGEKVMSMIENSPIMDQAKILFAKGVEWSLDLKQFGLAERAQAIKTRLTTVPEDPAAQP
jgi:hypothetical protein